MDNYRFAESPDGEQRWNHGRQRFVPPTERFDPSRASVEILDEKTAKPFVCLHHYSHSFPAARFRTGLFQKSPFGPDKLVGVAVFGVCIQPLAIHKYLGVEDANDGVELSRLILLDEALFNAETWFTARSLKLLRKSIPSIKGVISYCDPVARYDQDGNETKRGHVGTVYRASNANYHGVSGPRTHILTADGRVLSERTLSKLRQGDKGADYAYRQLIAMGAPPRRPMEGDEAYVLRALAEGDFRKTRHPGNHVYSWPFRAA
jgi:hypothetical protein